MKKIGIVGGVGWPSTVDYYSGICARSQKWHDVRGLPGLSIPEMSIESLDLRKAISYIGNDSDQESWARFDEYHRAALRRLQKSGAEFAVVASNSPHHRYDEIVQGIHIPVIDLFEEVAKECVRIDARQVLILGTALTMGSDRLREVFSKDKVEAVSPVDEKDKASCIDIIEALQIEKTAGAAERLGEIARRSFHNRSSCKPVVCLACTELPLAFPGLKTMESFEIEGVVYINSTAVHIASAFQFVVSESLTGETCE